MIQKIMRKRRRYDQDKSVIELSKKLEVDDIETYKKFFKEGQDPGFKGLKEISKNRDLVRLTATVNDDDKISIVGTISHYDDLFNQLVVLTNGTLKRLVFDQIIDVEKISDGDVNEEVYSG